MGLFEKRKKADVSRLEQFASTHEGVEAYLEPETATLPQSLLLVARDGEWTRAPIADRGLAAQVCKRLNLPFYDASVVGYPDRMRGMKGTPAPSAPSPEELAEWFSREADGPDH